MKKYVLDASALVRYVDREPGSDTVGRILTESLSGEVELLISAVNWGEVVYIIAKACGVTQNGLGAATDLLDKVRATPLQIVPVEGFSAEQAAMFKANFGIPYADAFAGTLALREDAVLVTADNDFKALPHGTIRVEFLPAKKPRKARSN